MRKRNGSGLLVSDIVWPSTRHFFLTAWRYWPFDSWAAVSRYMRSLYKRVYVRLYLMECVCVFVYIYMCVCVCVCVGYAFRCVCVCLREREREREREPRGRKSVCFSVFRSVWVCVYFSSNVFLCCLANFSHCIVILYPFEIMLPSGFTRVSWRLIVCWCPWGREGESVRVS